MKTIRELKFRAWDTFNERMIEHPYMFEKSNSSDKIDDPRFDTPFIYYETWGDVEDGIRRPCIIMQFTELRDKNGKDIWEGDIVKFHDHPEGIQDGIGEVYWKDGMYMLTWSLLPLGSYGTAWVEVIGNIYQNTELIKL